MCQCILNCPNNDNKNATFLCILGPWCRKQKLFKIVKDRDTDPAKNVFCERDKISAPLNRQQWGEMRKVQKSEFEFYPSLT